MTDYRELSANRDAALALLEAVRDATASPNGPVYIKGQRIDRQPAKAE